MRCYVLAKNEEANISRCVSSLRDAMFEVIVLDSGSNDATVKNAHESGAIVEPFTYSGHAEAYNELTMRHTPDEYIMIIDADIVISKSLAAELKLYFAASNSGIECICAPVAMVWAGVKLRHASLYPNKPFVFRGGSRYFRPVGHGEALVSGVAVLSLGESLYHDDRKPYDAYLITQSRYGGALSARAASGDLNWRDRIRVRLPLFILISPVFSYLVRLGFLDGRAGYLYALDRLIAEAISHRIATEGRLKRNMGSYE